MYVVYRTGFYEEGDEPNDGVMWLATDIQGAWTRSHLADHLPYPNGGPALRVRDDGRPVVAFPAGGIRVATATSADGTAFQVQRIADTSHDDSGVSLVLASDDAPRLAFAHDAGKASMRGTVYARPSGSGWALDRFTPRFGLVAISIDTRDQPVLAVSDGYDEDGIFLDSGSLQREQRVTESVPNALSFRVTGAGPMVLAFTTDKARANLRLTIR